MTAPTPPPDTGGRPAPDTDRPPDRAEPFDGGGPPARGGTRAMVLRYAFYAATAAIVAAAAFIVPLPFIEYVPGTPTAIPPLVEIDGVDTTDLQGETSLLTIFLRQQPTVPALGALLDARRDLQPTHRVYRPGLDRQDHLSAERELFSRQFDVAAVVGARAAGIDADLVAEVVVFDVGIGSPADGALEPEDAILEANGVPIIAAEELQAITRAADDGDVLTLTIRRDDELLEREVVLAPFGPDDEVRLGIHLETAVMDVALPFDVTLAEGTRIGGPSAGMMVGLTIYDLLAEEDLLAGRHVMGTGSLDADGRVGQIGGVEEKMVAAARADADLVLVPAQQFDAARGAAPDDLEVVGVETLDEAIEVLRDTAPTG